MPQRTRHGNWIGALSLSFLILLEACASAGPQLIRTDVPSVETQDLLEKQSSLRALALRRGIRLGVAVSVQPLRQDPRYAQTVRQEFNALTPENAMKWDMLRPSRDRFDFADADTLVDFAHANDMLIRGHTLIWHGQLPAWLKTGTFTAEELRDILREHILTVVGRYRGRVDVWDVVNEAVDEDEPSSLRKSLWLRKLGEEYIAMAFRWAHEADPQARLFYNDIGGEGSGPKSDAIYQLLKKLLDQGVPIHGVGLQMHVGMHDVPLPNEVAVNMARLAALGLEIHITEMDVQVQKGTGVADYDRASQARIYQDMTTVCLQTPTCKMLVVWGLTDSHSWIPWWTKHPDEPLLFDEAYRPKPAYYAIKNALETETKAHH